MAPTNDVNLWLARKDDSIASNWTTERGDLHFYNYGFDDYDSEVISLKTAYEHRTDVKALDWEKTHRKWTGDTWQLDFPALDTAVKHFLNRGYTITIAASDLTIFLSDYEAPFLEAHIPAEPPPDTPPDDGGPDDHPDLSDFS